MVIYLPQQSQDETPLLDELTPRDEKGHAYSGDHKTLGTHAGDVFPLDDEPEFTHECSKPVR